MNGGRDPESGNARWWGDSLAESDDRVVSAVALLVLGAGLGSLFGVPVLDAIEFWVIFAIGYAVVVPLTSLLRGRSAASARDRPRESGRDGSEGADADADDALDRLRDRYARGELSEAQFERKLETLLETETPEDARERLDRAAEPDGRDGDAEPEFERSE
jgi:uncharacterized membrane protein